MGGLEELEGWNSGACREVKGWGGFCMQCVWGELS